MVRCEYCSKNLGHIPKFIFKDKNEKEKVFCLNCYLLLSKDELKSLKYIGIKDVNITGIGPLIFAFLFLLNILIGHIVFGIIPIIILSSLGSYYYKRFKVSMYESKIRDAGKTIGDMDNIAIDTYGYHFWLLEEKQRKNLIKHINEFICPNCKETFYIKDPSHMIECPHCGARAYLEEEK